MLWPVIIRIFPSGITVLMQWSLWVSFTILPLQRGASKHWRSFTEFFDQAVKCWCMFGPLNKMSERFVIDRFNLIISECGKSYFRDAWMALFSFPEKCEMASFFFLSWIVRLFYFAIKVLGLNDKKSSLKHFIYFQFDGQDVLVPYTHYQKKKGRVKWQVVNN